MEEIIYLEDGSCVELYLDKRTLFIQDNAYCIEGMWEAQDSEYYAVYFVYDLSESDLTKYKYWEPSELETTMNNYRNSISGHRGNNEPAA